MGLARKLNTSLAFFVHDAFSLMDRGFVFTLIKAYLKKVTCIYFTLQCGIICLPLLVQPVSQRLQSHRISIGFLSYHFQS